MGTRKNYRRLTDDERNRFVRALHHVKTNRIIDDFARVHAHHATMGIHQSSHFLPWHREFVRRFEVALQTFDPSVSIPYWDSTVDRSPSDPLWDPNFLGQFDRPWRLNRALGSWTLPTQAQVDANQHHDKYEEFWRELEEEIHNPPHMWVGGVMAGTSSPGDPIFFMHHAWIDMLWVRWQMKHRHASFVASGPRFGVNDPMMEWPDRTPAHVLDHRALGYDYDIEQQAFTWLHNVPSWNGHEAAGGTSPTSWYTPTDDCQHIAYVGTDHKVHEAFFRYKGDDAFKWGHYVPSWNGHDVAPGTSPTSWYTPTDDCQHIAYVGTDHKIHEAFFRYKGDDAFKWGHYVPSWNGHDVAPGTSPTSWYTPTDDCQHIAYVCVDLKIHEAFFRYKGEDAFKWGHYVPSWNGYEVLAGTSPTSWYTPTDDCQHIAYVGTDHKIHEAFFRYR
jgi:hypothetical protein